MAVWRCPHCATPQSEAARCWVCHRSTTSCATCRHFRRSVATGFGICGLDPRRVALTGSEMRACWTVPDPVLEAERESPAVAAHRAPATLAGDRLPRTFVPVDELVAGGPGSATPASAPPVAGSPSARSPMAAPSAPGDRVTGPAWSLWGEPDA